MACFFIIDVFIDENKGTLAFVDPAMADNGRLYTGFDETNVRRCAALCREADVFVPNITEACLLTGTAYAAPGSAQAVRILPFALSNAYSSTLRETGQTVVPMVGGISAVVVNLALNYVLIFGHFGAPRMGVAGAAVATVISRYVELAVVAVWTHTHGKEKPFIRGAFRSLRIPAQLLRRLIVKGSPLMINEFFWSAGVAIRNQCFSTCGLDVVAAQNISSTLYNLSSVVYMALGGAVGIIIGQMLGRGESEAAVRDADRKLITVSVLSCLVFGGVMAAFSGAFPMIYNTTDEVRYLAMQLICISALMMPFNAFAHASYFTIRSGGQTMITFLFDSGFMWAVCVPLAFFLSRFTDMPIVPLYCICQGAEIVKCGLGGWLLSRGKWINNLTAEK